MPYSTCIHTELSHCSRCVSSLPYTSILSPLHFEVISSPLQYMHIFTFSYALSDSLLPRYLELCVPQKHLQASQIPHSPFLYFIHIRLPLHMSAHTLTCLPMAQTIHPPCKSISHITPYILVLLLLFLSLSVFKDILVSD